MNYPRHISKPDEVLVKFFKEALALSWDVPYSAITIHHIQVNSQDTMLVSCEVRLNNGQIIFDTHEEY